MGWLSLSLLTLICSSLSSLVHGYVPAIASNATEGSGLDVHDNSKVILTWDPDSSYTTVVSYQQAGNESTTGVSRGALIKVKEEDLWNNDTTTTPWIALIGCDRNATNATMANDIFTMVRDRGAIAALLYSNTSDGCLLNPEYHYGEDFHQIFDIFTSKEAAKSILIQSQFANVKEPYQTFNPKLLNDSAAQIQDAINTNVNKSPYIVATLRAANATEPEIVGGSAPGTITTATNHDGPSQSLAMIILYVIVSLVAALFIIVIVSGAIRAFRHPERYGPRLYDPTLDGEDGQPQTRAGGITRAILDTFPVIKWGSSANHNYPSTHLQRHELKQVNLERAHESNRDLLHSSHSSASALPDSRHLHSPSPHTLSDATPSTHNAVSFSSAVAGTSSKSPRTSVETNTLDPSAIGKETCPICIVDFEDGDDIRVLPCEGKHRFHKDCVDLWLLELSSSCPICREDFQALEIMAAAADGYQNHDEDDPVEPIVVTPASRFSRYLQFAQKRRRSRREQPLPSSSSQPEPSTSKAVSPIPPVDG